jgi:hypothetical protein
MDGEGFGNRAAPHLQGIAGLYKARGQNMLSNLPTRCSLYGWAFSQLVSAVDTDESTNAGQSR